MTSFEYRLHALGPQVLAGVILHPAERAREVLRFYRDYLRDIPDDLTTIVNLRYAPPAPFLPTSMHGRAVVIIAVCYAGPVEQAQAVLAPLRAFGDPLIDLIPPTPYLAHQSMFDASVPHGLHYYWKSHYLKPLNDEAIHILVAHAWQAPSATSYTIIFHLGGAIRRVDGMATAFEDRRAEHALNINAVWADHGAADRPITWTRQLGEAMEPVSTGGVYVNFLGDEGDQRVRDAYGPEKYRQLTALKAKYDPNNLFRLNQNIRPAPELA